MFLKELYRKIGIELEVHNIVTDYTLSDDRARAHIAHQIVANGISCTDKDIIARIREALPAGSRIACIVEVFGDYELTQLEELASTQQLLKAQTRWLYHDMDLVKEYMAEYINEG